MSHECALAAIQAAATAHLADDDATAQRACQRARDAAHGAVAALRRLAPIGLGVAQHAHAVLSRLIAADPSATTQLRVRRTEG